MIDTIEPTETTHREPRASRSGRHRARRRAIALAVALVLPLPCLASAQDAPSIDTILGNIESAADALQDVTFVLTGKLIDPDGTEIQLDVDMQLIPGERLASAYIIQPDALADNQFLLDGDVVKSYTFLTNQITLFDAGDPDALGGLLPGGGEDGSPQISFDIGQIFAGYDASLTGTTEQDGVTSYHLSFANKDPEATVMTVLATVPDSDWLPRKLEFLQRNGAVLAELNAEDMEIDTGLDPAEVAYLPSDAEVIDNRSKD